PPADPLGPDPKQPIDWMSALRPYLKNPSTVVCPVANKTPSYEFNKHLTGASMTAIGDIQHTVMLYEGGNGLLDFRHEGKANVAFTDTHVAPIGGSDTWLKWELSHK